MSQIDITALRPATENPTVQDVENSIANAEVLLGTKSEELTIRKAQHADLLLKGTPADIRRDREEAEDLQIEIDQLSALLHALRPALTDAKQRETVERLRIRGEAAIALGRELAAERTAYWELVRAATKFADLARRFDHETSAYHNDLAQSGVGPEIQADLPKVGRVYMCTDHRPLWQAINLPPMLAVDPEDESPAPFYQAATQLVPGRAGTISAADLARGRSPKAVPQPRPLTEDEIRDLQARGEIKGLVSLPGRRTVG